MIARIMNMKSLIAETEIKRPEQPNPVGKQVSQIRKLRRRRASGQRIL